ncbi:hypothetical protein AB0O20_25155 [Streptomyces kronopolitis]|uniref:hypothetical protein n=1 Tax=Streptomyces kronopolitis TaxID=1612435 RepID=UPI003423C876
MAAFRWTPAPVNGPRPRARDVLGAARRALLHARPAGAQTRPAHDRAARRGAP